MSTHVLETQKKPGQIPALESLRGWAILLVVAFHYFGILHNVDAVHDKLPFWLRIIGAGNTGVTLFFVLSGFLLTRYFILGQTRKSEGLIKRFAINRALRILPLYILVVLVAWGTTGNNAAALKAIVFIPVGFDMFPWSIPWWSLSTEAQFYLTLPVVFLCAARPQGRIILLTGLFLYVALYWWAFEAGGISNRLTFLNAQGTLLGRGPAFILGALAAWYHLQTSERRSNYTDMASLFIFLAAAISLGILLGHWGEAGARLGAHDLKLIASHETLRIHIIEALLWSIILLSILSSQSRWMIFIHNPLMAHLGKISYSIYLLHISVIFWGLSYLDVEKHDTLVEPHQLSLILLFTIPPLWLLSCATYSLVEKPFLALKKK